MRFERSSPVNRHLSPLALGMFAFVFLAPSLHAGQRGAIDCGVRASRADDIPPAAMSDAKEIFSSRCIPCHGPAGKGDGPASAALNPKPRNLSDPVWQKSVTDEYIEKIVKYGGSAVGKSPMMPANPDLNAKPAVVTGVRVVVRSLAQQ